jgi:hypothetical protein
MRLHIFSLIISILFVGNCALAANDETKDRDANASDATKSSPPTSSAPSTEPPAAPTGPSPNSTSQQAAPQGGQSPLSFKIGAAQFTPGGFLDMAAYYRSENLGSGLATSFGAVPFNNVLPQGRLSETHLSAQYSRLSLKVDADLTSSTAITGYVEADFLGFQPPNANITANSDSLRLRVYWADLKHGKWEFLGGQEWSLLQPNRVGISPNTADIFYTLNEDPNFQVGLIWARQPQFRITYHATKSWVIGASLENPQQFAPASVVFPSSTFTSQFDNGSSSTSAASSATNTAVPNEVPDVVLKTAFDFRPGGHLLHVEGAGLLRTFRVLNTLAIPVVKDTITGGAGSVNLNLELIKNLRLIADSFWAYGGGRYTIGLGPDAIVKPNGQLSGVHTGAGLGGLEWQAMPMLAFFGYYGGVYFTRNYGFLPSTAPGATCAGVSGFTCVGFGFPGSDTSANRTVQEGSFGVIPTVWSNDNYGKVQIITQYSYLIREPWFVTSGNPRSAHLNMAYIDFRYTLP